MATTTKIFGTGKREGHDASTFYNRKIFAARANTANWQTTD